MRGKVSLITGANTGIGKRTAKRLAELGSQVIIVCRNAAGGSSAVEEIQREIGNPNSYWDKPRIISSPKITNSI
jgi:NAD(P)-dependent dehydrogenase (short-subunit alcohol dehydrogenase family)